MPRQKISVIILAAGLGTRMKSELPKVLHKFDKVPMIIGTLKQALALSPQSVTVVVGYKGDLVKDEIISWAESNNISQPLFFVNQKVLKGSGMAVFEAFKSKSYSKTVLIISGDVPLLKSSTLANMLNKFNKDKSDCCILTCDVKEAKSYGRIIRNEKGGFEAIREACEASDNELAVKEINSGVYAFSAAALRKALKKLKPQGPKGEYYLTDCPRFIKEAGGRISLFKIKDELEISGVNSKEELSMLYLASCKRKVDELYAVGVNIIDPSSVYFSLETTIGADTIIHPHVITRGKVKIGKNCRVGPYCVLEDCEIGDNSEIKPFSCIYSSKAEKDVSIGPFSHLRPETFLSRKVKVGNFSEIKKSRIGQGSKVPHLSYIGDTKIGQDVNIGAGTITCNYDGINKNKTLIEDGAFIGSNTNLVAPVRVGRQSLIAAGSTITEDVPAGHLALARARQVIKNKRLK